MKKDKQIPKVKPNADANAVITPQPPQTMNPSAPREKQNRGEERRHKNEPKNQ